MMPPGHNHLGQADPRLVFFYGLAGAGKNFTGDLLGRLTGWAVYHADQDLTAPMRDAIAAKQIFTLPMLDEYFATVAARITSLCRDNRNLIVTQAVYRQRHRDYLQAAIRNLEMICVAADDATIIRRLLTRDSGITPDYFMRMKAGFQPPPPGEKIIVNVGGAAEITQQLQALVLTSHD